MIEPVTIEIGIAVMKMPMIRERYWAGNHQVR